MAKLPNINENTIPTILLFNKTPPVPAFMFLKKKSLIFTVNLIIPQIRFIWINISIYLKNQFVIYK